MTARDKIITLLNEHGGEFRAPAGNAGVLITEAVGGNYKTVSMTLYRMTQEGILEKEGTGKRAYAYRLLQSPPAAIPRETGRIPREAGQILDEDDTSPLLDGDVDYEQLAAALLRRVVAIESRRSEAIQVNRRLESEVDMLRAQSAHLTDEVRRMKAREAALQEELQTVRDSLEAARSRALELENSLKMKTRRGGAPIWDKLKDEEREMLRRMMEGLPKISGEGG